MIIEIGGGQRGFKEYLETGQKKGRDLHRNQLDQRVPLFGDLDVFEIATSSHAGEGQRYDHITLSFSENYVSDGMLQLAVAEFRDHALSAWPEAERHRIAFYAEAHRPKILGYTNSETGEYVERYTHIHVGVGRRDLETGKSVEVFGYLGQGSDNLKFIDAWQESFNARNGFASPKDNPKITPGNAVDVLARYTGTRPDALGTFNQRKAALEIILQKQIITQNITSWSDFANLLKEHGAVTVMHKAQFNECYRVKPRGSDKAMRLSGIFFQRDFIERPTAEKLSIISAKAKVAYLEQMQPRKTPEYLTATLDEWRTFKAREHRYLHTGSKFYNDVYKTADAQTRLHLLDQLEREHHAKPSPVSDNRRKKIAAARDRVPGMPARDLDGIQKRSEMLLRSDDVMDVPVESNARQAHLGVRQADGTGIKLINSSSQNDGDGSAEASHNPSTSQSVRGHDGSRKLGRAGSESGLFVTQPSSLVERHLADLREQYERVSDKDRYGEIRKSLDCHQLLNSLSHSHGLNPDVYQVVAAKDGTPRIQCGTRALSPSDFLMKELGLPWKEAAPILRRVYEQQIKREIIKPRGKGASTKLWKAFQANQQGVKLEVSKRLKVFDEVAKARRTALSLKLKGEQTTALSGLSGEARKAAHSLEKLRLATVKTEFNLLLKQERQAVRSAIQPKDAWPLYLQARAQAGDEEALSTLRKLDAAAREAKPRAASITGTLILEDAVVSLKSLVHVIERNGDVLYRQNGRAILRDEGRHIAVLDENSDQAIVTGLLIAREKFGSTLTLTGSQEFQQRVVALTVSQGIAVKFADPVLEEMRLRLVGEKRKAMQPTTRTPATRTPARQKPGPVVPSSQPAQREQAPRAAPPVAEAHTEQIQSEDIAVPMPLTGKEWIATQDKKEVQAHESGNATVEYSVAHVAADCVVINYGRVIACYPLPPNAVLQAGQKIVIDKSGAVIVPVQRVEVGGGKGRGD